MPLTVVVGGFFGDEGKGKIVGYLALADRVAAAVRTGATNAGHTVVHDGNVYKLRALPSAIVNPHTRLYIARGALVHYRVLLEEVEKYNARGRVVVDAGTGIITDEHVERERRDEHLAKRIGSTLTGVGAAMVDRVLRKLALARDIPELRELTGDVQELVWSHLDKGDSVVVEATQGYWLSLYHGTYPYVTSRDTTASAALSEIGLGPRDVDDVIVVFKAFVTRVGEGPLPGEIPPEEAEKLGWVEYGTVTGRRRRVAPFNIQLAKKAVRANTATGIAITKVDVVFPEAKGVREWEKLPKEAKKWIEELEAELGVPVLFVGTGEEVVDTIDRRREVARR
ncbi:Adenylosuccinate synthase [Pyrolobus fumarii 1A]|uniref:Adenylosuccinate synthetase n=1 Tax=Pyrolobus fumarii (strain DSM 11204 / 1A) TaxID=694429 RepID=G0EE65_PYRF1|nr:adenylosuccinate synthetase [Pyrolobus fumarii]AEM38759.1 Adenylosuccinate synthase [Pyrolobus fumarii 1A]